ncbi:MAG: ATP--guanido phosphotransferase [Lentisphaerae bacterium]|nr:ATP--guanido phosphotransferase [Lentisphaerota bacterium]
MSLLTTIEEPLSEEDYRETFGVVLTSRVRLARNLRGERFPDRATAEERTKVLKQVRKAALAELTVQEELANQTPLYRQYLFEEHLISRTLLEKRPQSAICMDGNKRRVVMINEEDHLRIQALRPGLALQEAWADANELDDLLEAKLDYAFSPTLGYLTSCPTNVGTGMRTSALMHLPGLVLMQELEAIVRGLNKIGLTVRGRWGEGTAALGNMFQVSNQITLGLPEERIVQDLEQIVRELATHETNARERFYRERRRAAMDLAGRAEGILKSARMMTTQEALERLSDLRLGIALGLTKKIEMRTVDRLLLEVQPAHLIILADRPLNEEKRDAYRADRLRSELKKRKSRQPKRTT